MRIGIISTIIASHLYWAASGLSQEPGAALPALTALRFFDGLGTADGDSVLRALRRKPIGARQRDLVRSKLPSTGAVTPTRDEAKKLAAMLPVLVYHERGDVFDVKVIDIPQAYIGLYHRATLLVSRSALSVLRPSEFQALAAHEIGHELLWEAFERQPHGSARQSLELECDGIAALTLRSLD